MGNKQISGKYQKENDSLKKKQEEIVNEEDFNIILGVGDNVKPKVLLFDTEKEIIKEIESPLIFPIHNYCSLLMLSPQKVFLTGGITKNLKTITNLVYEIDASSNPLKSKQLPSLNMGRYTHMSVINKNFLYVMGGRTFGSDEKGILNNCEKIDIKNPNNWESVAPMNKQRCTGFALVYQEQIYVFGGYTGPKKRSKKIERYDEVLNHWEILFFRLNGGIEAGSLYPIDLDEFIIFGGNYKKGPSNESILLNLKEGTIKDYFPMNNPRILAKSFIDFKKGNLYVLGGDVNNTCERFSYLTSKKWELINVNLDEHLNSAEFKSFSSVLPNYTIHSNNEKKLPAKPLNYQKNKQKKNDFEEKKMALIKEENADLDEIDADYVSSEKDELFYLFGTDSEPYIIEFNNTKRISKIINPNSPLQLQGYQGGVKTSKNCYFIAGGINSSLDKIHHDVFLFMGLENETLKLESMSIPRYTFNVVLQYPWVYILGGRTYGNDQEGILNSCERYNLEKQEWQSIAPLNFRRCTAMAFGWSNGVYIAGGYMGSLKRENRFECYLEDQNKWEIMGIELLEPLEASSFLITESKLLFIGGRVHDGDTNKIWSYDVSNGFDAFYGDTVGSMKAKRCLHKSCQLNKDFILLLGGDSYENSVEIFHYNKEKNMVNAKEEYLFDDIRKSLLKNIKKCFKESKLQKNLLL